MFFLDWIKDLIASDCESEDMMNILVNSLGISQEVSSHLVINALPGHSFEYSLNRFVEESMFCVESELDNLDADIPTYIEAIGSEFGLSEEMRSEFTSSLQLAQQVGRCLNFTDWIMNRFWCVTTGLCYQSILLNQECQPNLLHTLNVERDAGLFQVKLFRCESFEEIDHPRNSLQLEPGQAAESTEEILFYHGTYVRHADNIILNGVDSQFFKLRNDFGSAFYLTKSFEHAFTWARSLVRMMQNERKIVLYSIPCVLIYKIKKSELEALPNFQFTTPSPPLDEWGEYPLWQKFVRHCRAEQPSDAFPLPSEVKIAKLQWIRGPEATTTSAFFDKTSSRPIDIAQPNHPQTALRKSKGLAIANQNFAGVIVEWPQIEKSNLHCTNNQL